MLINVDDLLLVGYNHDKVNTIPSILTSEFDITYRIYRMMHILPRRKIEANKD